MSNLHITLDEVFLIEIINQLPNNGLIFIVYDFYVV